MWIRLRQKIQTLNNFRNIKSDSLVTTKIFLIKSKKEITQLKISKLIHHLTRKHENGQMSTKVIEDLQIVF